MEIQDIEIAVYKALQRYFRQDKLYSYNAIAKRLGISFTTVKNLVSQGLIKTTKDGKFISEKNINEYLKNKYEEQ